jgi:hypothetical protein
MATILPPPHPRRDLIIHGVDYVDLQACFVRVDRGRAEEILAGWARADELTAHERAEILARFDTAG